MSGGMPGTPGEIPFLDLAAQAAEEGAALQAALARGVMDGGWVGGPLVAELEAALAAALDVPHVVAVSSGTDALMLGMVAAGIAPGDEVITPPNSFVASTAAIRHIGAVPVFADVADDINIDPEAVERAIGPRTRAIMPVHLGGRVCDMHRIGELAQAHGLLVIEDAAQAFGSKFQDRAAGSFGTVGCFSTHPAKNLNGVGDGGFVATADAAIADRIRRLRSHGTTPSGVVEFGFVSRLDNVQASVLLMRLERLPSVEARRRRNADLYLRLLQDSPVRAVPERQHEYNTWSTFRVEAPDRDRLAFHLRQAGIQTAMHYPVPIHLQPAAAGLGYKAGDFPETERQAAHTLSLPVHQSLGEEAVARIAAAIGDFYRSRPGGRV